MKINVYLNKLLKYTYATLKSGDNQHNQRSNKCAPTQIIKMRILISIWPFHHQLVMNGTAILNLLIIELH